MNTPAPTAVCIIVENLPVPFDRRVWQEARALRDAGYRVSVISPKRGAFTRGYERLEEIEIYRHSLPEGVGPLGYLFEYSWALAAEFLLALKVYRRTRFRILHACNPPDTIFLIALFFRLFRVRFIFDHHDLNPELFEAKFGRKSGLFYRLVCWAERMTYRTASVSIATNESYREVAIRRGAMKPERVFIVRSTPDLENVRLGEPQEELKRGKRFLVLYLGVMGPQEGVDLLIESVEFISRERGLSEIAVVLIGDGSELARLKALAAGKRLDSSVHFTGRIPDEALAAYLSTADVCVAPDPKNPMNDRSTMNKVLEYMAYGRPVVLFDLIEGRRAAGEAALYATPDDPEDFARQIMNLLDSTALREKLGDAGRRRIAHELNWKNEMQRLFAAYESVLDANR